MHAAGESAGKVIVKAVSEVAGGKVEFGFVVVGGRVQPPCLGLSTLGQAQPYPIPTIEVLDLRGHRTDLFNSAGRVPVQQRTVERVVHALVGEEIKIGAAGWFGLALQRCCTGRCIGSKGLRTSAAS